MIGEDHEDDSQGCTGLDSRIFSIGICDDGGFTGAGRTDCPPGHYCLSYDEGGTDCSFTSYAQCLATASGIDAEC